MCDLFSDSMEAMLVSWSMRCTGQHAFPCPVGALRSVLTASVSGLSKLRLSAFVVGAQISIPKVMHGFMKVLIILT